MYRSLALIIILLMLPTAHAQEQWEHPDSRLSFTVFNNAESRVGAPGHHVTMKMYSQNRRGKEWGPYEIAPYKGGRGRAPNNYRLQGGRKNLRGRVGFVGYDVGDRGWETGL